MSKTKNKVVLVTGGAGFIGSNLCMDLIDNNEVICLDNLMTGKLDNLEDVIHHSNFRFVEGDIRNANTVREVMYGVDVVLHQAALGSVPRSINNPLLTNAVNIEGFLTVLNEAVKANVNRFVYAASSSTYGDHPGLPKVEDKIGKPLSPYAVTKLVNELYADVFSKLHGIETIGLRYFNVFGRHQDPNGAYAAAIPKFIKAFIDHHAPTINGDGSQTRDFTYVDNVVQANNLAATTENKEALNQVYNVAFGATISLNELIIKLKDLLSEYDSEIATINPEYGPERKGDVKHSFASIHKAEKYLNYQPEYSLEKGLEQAIKWYWNYFKA
ncbi:MAG: LPS biosynthesis protein WbpP [Crocinitomicaceae bacterium]|nr:LPS biosynthesis protein WbpP [Crocinitomicaceae bacterium]|tara:strand:+ start:13979 stop:14962 length:984 start_codon:yes stop_codon:yes gene_type:complete